MSMSRFGDDEIEKKITDDDDDWSRTWFLRSWAWEKNINFPYEEIKKKAIRKVTNWCEIR